MPKQLWCAEVKKTRHRILDFKRIQERIAVRKRDTEFSSFKSNLWCTQFLQKMNEKSLFSLGITQDR